LVARIKTVSFRGIDVLDIDVEVQISSGFVAFTIVGLPDKAVAESRERVRAALHAMGLALPAKRITINLAPADVSKEGSHYDLPIALGLLTAMEVLPSDALNDFLALGELGLDASLRSVTGILPAAVHAQKNNLGLVCPQASGSEAAWAGDLDILAPASLLQLINHFKGTQILTRPSPVLPPDAGRTYRDLSEVKGQETAKRALEITAAGGHNLMMV
jgi:magnesium chelatase family protein